MHTHSHLLHTHTCLGDDMHACSRLISFGNRATLWQVMERKLRGEELVRKESEDALKATNLDRRQSENDTETQGQIAVTNTCK
jgi:hypothetical protein